MRTVVLLVFSILYQALPLRGQFVCFSDSSTIYEFKGTHLPPMIGEAVFHSGDYKVVIGGKFLDKQDVISEAVYNCDVLILDYKAQKTYVLPLSYFPPFIADQFSGVNYCYTMDKDTAYLMGGFGYDLALSFETTFPMLTKFPVKTLIDSVLQHKDYLELFTSIEDERLAITEGTLVHIAPYFLVYNGRELTPIIDDISDRIMMNEWDFRGQLRKFSISRAKGFPAVDEFQVCSTSKVFYQCMPGKWGKEPRALYEIDPND